MQKVLTSMMLRSVAFSGRPSAVLGRMGVGGGPLAGTGEGAEWEILVRPLVSVPRREYVRWRGGTAPTPANVLAPRHGDKGSDQDFPLSPFTSAGQGPSTHPHSAQNRRWAAGERYAPEHHGRQHFLHAESRPDRGG